MLNNKAIMDITTVKDQNGTPLYRAVNVLDITEQKKQEQKLKDALEELKKAKEYSDALFSNSPIAIYSVDQDSRIVNFNKKAERREYLNANTNWLESTDTLPAGTMNEINTKIDHYFDGRGATVTKENKFKVYTPPAVSLQVDYHWKQDYYLNNRLILQINPRPFFKTSEGFFRVLIINNDYGQVHKVKSL